MIRQEVLRHLQDDSDFRFSSVYMDLNNFHEKAMPVKPSGISRPSQKVEATSRDLTPVIKIIDPIMNIKKTTQNPSSLKRAGSGADCLTES